MHHFIYKSQKKLLVGVQPLPQTLPDAEGINHLIRTPCTRSLPCGSSTGPLRLKTW